MGNYYVYAYLRSEDSTRGLKGSPYYIGKGQGARIRKEHNVHVPRDKSNIVLLASGLNEPDAFQIEMLLIHLNGRVDLGTGCLRNLTDGGEGNSRRVFSEEARRKISLIHKGKKVSVETRQRMRESMKARPPSTVCRRGHLYTQENVYRSTDGQRLCRECRRLVQIRAYRKRGIRERRDDCCLSGHTRTPENIYTNPTTGKRACRVCIRLAEARRRLEAQARHDVEA